MKLETILLSEGAKTIQPVKYSLDSNVSSFYHKINSIVKIDTYIFVGLALFSIALTTYAVYKYYKLINDDRRYRHGER